MSTTHTFKSISQLSSATTINDDDIKTLNDTNTVEEYTIGS